MNLRVIGYTCDLGSASINQWVGIQRTESVTDYLEAQGIPRNRMDLVSKGELTPIVPNLSVSIRKKNRRVTFEVLSEYYVQWGTRISSRN
ncbi:OmpA family protein [Galbibacter sp.]|uniref:OmpA family protein n=1 Tax=Galbibacter sp. TaxID=2918471 RepID=UPI003A8FDB2D